MTPETRFSRWAAVGVPLFLLGGIAGIAVIHLSFQTAWLRVIPPVSLFVGLQITAYLGAFWAGKWAREERRYGPISLLGGLYFWVTGILIIRYGSLVGLVQPVDNYLGFTLAIAFVTLFAWVIVVRATRRFR